MLQTGFHSSCRSKKKHVCPADLHLIRKRFVHPFQPQGSIASTGRVNFLTLWLLPSLNPCQTILPGLAPVAGTLMRTRSCWRSRSLKKNEQQTRRSVHGVNYRDLEDEGHVEVTINSHDIQRVSAGSDESRALSLISFCCHVENQFIFEWYCDSSISKWLVLCLLNETR